MFGMFFFWESVYMSVGEDVVPEQANEAEETTSQRFRLQCHWPHVVTAVCPRRYELRRRRSRKWRHQYGGGGVRFRSRDHRVKSGVNGDVSASRLWAKTTTTTTNVRWWWWWYTRGLFSHWIWCRLVKVKKGLKENLSQCVRASPAIWDHTVLQCYLPLDTGECAALEPQPGKPVLDFSSPDGWKAELIRVVGWVLMVYLPVDCHPSKYNRARVRQLRSLHVTNLQRDRRLCRNTDISSACLYFVKNFGYLRNLVA